MRLILDLEAHPNCLKHLKHLSVTSYFSLEYYDQFIALNNLFRLCQPHGITAVNDFFNNLPIKGKGHEVRFCRFACPLKYKYNQLSVKT